MKFIILLFFSSLLQNAPPSHFRAYAVAAGGKNMIVSPDYMRYVTCNVDVQLKDKHFRIGKMVGAVYRKEKIDDSVVALFAYNIQGRDSVFCSISLIPIEGSKDWRILMVWEDSTKAFKAKPIR